MLNDTCPWHLFHEEERKDIEDQLFTLRACSGMLSFWLTLGIFCSPSLKHNLSYQNILAFFTSGFIRNSMPTAINHGVPIMKEFSMDLPMHRRCGLFGFLQTLLAIHEVECLTHICIERYVVAKYITNGWSMPRWYYLLYRILCTSFAFVYSVAPLLGVGGYAMDFICADYTMDVILPEGLMKYIAAAVFALRSIKPAGFMYVSFAIYCSTFLACVYSVPPLLGVGGYAMDFICADYTMDVILPKGLMKYIAAAIFALRSIKPAGFMIVMLIWAKRLESNFSDNPNNLMQKETTQLVVWLSAVYVACLTPIALIQGRIVLSQLLYGSGVFTAPSPFYVHMALYLHASAVANSIIVLLVLSPIIREVFLSLRPQHFYRFVVNLFKKDSSAVNETSPTQN